MQKIKPSILITGIKGFLGRHLSESLKKDHEIWGVGKNEEIFNYTKVYSSLELNKIIHPPDYIVMCHAAVASGNFTPTIEVLNEVNVNLTKKIITKFPKSKIIYVSSASIYETTQNVISETSQNNPQNNYSKSKYIAEKIVLNHKNSVICRFSSLFGIGMKENTLIPNFINQALQKKTIEVWGSGDRKQNYLSVEDACGYILSTIQKFNTVKNHILLCVNKKEVSNSELANIIAKKTNSYIYHIKEDFSKSLHYNNNLTCELLEWEPKINFETEINNYIKWKKKEQF
jgi:UDP-glucose 4-epimerase